jgi:putative MATE family efflux protein
MSVGGSILVAQAVGQDDSDSANDAVLGTLTLSLVSGTVLTLLVLAISPLLIGLMGVEPAVSALGIPYLRLMALSFPLNFMLLSAGGCIRGAGDARTPLLVMTAANGVHAVLALLLAFGAGLGLTGLALATIISRGTGLVIFLLLLLRGIAHLRLDRWRPNPAAMRDIWRVGSAVGGEQLALRLGQLVNLRLITTLGTQMLAVYTVVLNSLSTILMVGLGFMAATLTIVGQQIGADEQSQIHSTGWRVIYLAWAFMGGLALLYFMWPVITHLFSSDATVLNLAELSLRVIVISIPFEVVNQVLTGALRGAGDTRYPMYITTLGHWLIRLPLIVLFIGTFDLGLNGIWFAMIVEMLVRAILNILRFRRSFHPALVEAGVSPT